ncbi:GGDEF domain-containing protein [Dactylosporangium sp. NPDC048998]|uniref:GGDEF domain-containing protein n=1 Tax=Dactylosporangium sp. NPDC048998 TaxID=3363976 RepID=UPI0037114512
MDPLAFLAGAAAAAGACAVLPLYLRARRAERLAERLTAELEVERHAADHDPLTGLPNRRAFYKRGAQLVSDRARHPLVAVVLDVDGFKQINDMFGHSAGDEVLVTTARRLAEYAGSGLVARLGGDEFAGLLAGRHDGAQEQADRLAQTLAAPMRLAGQIVTVSVSVGLVPVEPDAHLADAVHRADAAMYRSKGGRRRPVLAGHPHVGAHQHVVHTTLRLGKPRLPAEKDIFPRPTTAN